MFRRSASALDDSPIPGLLSDSAHVHEPSAAEPQAPVESART
jgi:hypothetical protein